MLRLTAKLYLSYKRNSPLLLLTLLFKSVNFEHVVKCSTLVPIPMDVYAVDIMSWELLPVE